MSFSRGRVAGAMVLAVSSLAVTFRASLPAQQATFRSTVDLVAVEVQVVDRDGYPMTQFGPEKFEVTIDGRRRRVISADFVQSATIVRPDRAASDAEVLALRARSGRVFVMAVDVGSFTVGASRGAVQAARAFVARLQPEDLVGLVTYPVGPTVSPTTDHALVSRRLDTIVGQQQALRSQYHLSVSEVIDITAESARVSTILGRGANQGPSSPIVINPETEALRRVQLRECGSVSDLNCTESIQLEATSLAFVLEGMVTEGMSRLRSVLTGMAELPGRKTVVVMSAGMPVSDRPGGRPDMTDMGATIGEEAARANATIYAIHLDSDSVEAFSADKQRPAKRALDQGRESALLGRLLDGMSGASGGTMFRVLVGSGEGALEQILRETSSHYLLGVVPDASDQDGRLRQLRVKVNAADVNVRSRMWVVVPKRAPAK